MKNKLYIIAFILLTPILVLNFYYPAIETKTSPPPLPYTDKFLIGCMQSYKPFGNNTYYNETGFNTTHQYVANDSGQFANDTDRHTPKSWLTGGEGLFAAVPTQTIRNVINEMYTDHNQSRFIWQRPKIEWLAFGQSSVYQAEKKLPGTDPYWFYTFNKAVGNVIPDNQFNDGDSVLHVSNSESGPGAKIVLERLMANTEQCRKMTSGGNEWCGDSECDWYVKPRLRAFRNFIVNPANKEIEILKVYVKMQDGTTDKIAPVSIKAKHFQRNYQTSNLYSGDYIDKFYFVEDQDPQYIQFKGELGDTYIYGARGECETDAVTAVHADFKIEWSGNCEMWIDYIKVENDVADRLLKGNDLVYEQWISDEANAVNVPPYVYNFYTELFEFNNIPCMAYVNKKIDSITGGKINFMADQLTQFNHHMPWGLRHTINTPEMIEELFFDRTEMRQIYLGDPYPITADTPVVCGGNSQYSLIPNTFTVSATNSDLFTKEAPGTYDRWLQGQMDTTCEAYESSDYTAGGNEPHIAGVYQFLMKRGNALSKSLNIPFVAMLQAHQWYSGGEIDREPTNEELNMMVNMAVSYGAKGIIYWWYPSFGNMTACNNYSFGFVDSNGIPRANNIYGQPKWDSLKRLNQRLEQWGPTLMSFDNTQTSSFIYRFERASCLSSTYFSDVISYKPGTGLPACNEDAPGGDVPPSLVYDCNQERYLQVSTFKKTAADPYEKYFMLVNKRCSPVQPDYNDGRRDIRVAFDVNSSELPDYTTWKITEILSNSEVGRFNKYLYNNYVDLGWFNPGEGKIYRLSPVMRTGGILAGDEVITGESFTCEAPVYNNGFNITIGANTTIHFNDSSKFVMSGGVFTVGDQNTSAPQNITSDAVPGGSWRGHSFTNCEVKIYGATFSGLANDTTYAVNIIDCPVVDIRNCTFNTNSSLKGGINAICFNNPFIAINNIYMGSNTFNSSGSTIPTVNVSSYAGVTTPLIVENNIFNEGNTAVFLSGVIGGAIKGNTISDNYIAINALTSSIDVVQNNISSTVNGSMGIFAAGGSELKLNSSGAFTLGGLNSISNEGTGTNNINVDGSYFLLEGGENIFNISSDQSSYHLYGYFPMFTAVTTEETNNCFKVDGSPVVPPINMVTSGYQGSQITFNFDPYLAGCEIIGGGDGLAINLGDGIYDTIYTGGSGSGGSMKEALPLLCKKASQN